MPTFKFKFYGTPAETPAEINEQTSIDQPAIKVEEYTALTVRSGEAKAVDIEVTENDIVTIQMSNDIEWLYNAEDFEKFLKVQPATRITGDGALIVPAFFIPTGGTRGFEDVVKTTAIKVITGMAARNTATLLVQKMESKLEGGVHALNDQFKSINFDKTRVVKDKSYLLFIHGTNSTTEGAFYGLKSNNVYTDLFKFYDGRVLAFEHKTLSESPLKNVTDLLKELPDEISIEIISHSRGGLIADLLARCSNAGLPFTIDELTTINDNPDFQPLKTEAEAANLAATGKNITVPKIVRVASPSAGTVLIDTRLDNLVNVFSNLIKLIPAAAACMPLGLFLDFARAVVHERTDISVFPGIAAQIPGSPLIRMLNNPNREIDSELFVISGDVEHSGLWKSLLVMSTNLYFGQAHDLVVDSNSMFKGTYRRTNVQECFEQAPTVNHFNYFKNPSSQAALIAALMKPVEITGCYQKLGISSKITVSHERGANGEKPVLYILPGITNSNLRSSSNANEILWINFKGLATGILSKISATAPDVIATDIQEEVYGDLINYMSADYDVKCFPYDWRMDLAEAGKKLAVSIQELMNPERTAREFHFIAHSMGGLVLRAMIHSDNQLWKKITESKKTKVLMLGVPNDGSYSIIRILLGKDAIIKKLALLDFVHSKQDLLDIFKDFTGLLQLLPKNKDGIFGEDEWNKLLKANNGGGKPLPELLQKAADFQDKINNTEFDNAIFRYVAGRADDTPEGYSITNNKVSFTSSPDGDGRVLWSTIPAGLNPENIYYVNADHGSIPQYVKAFEGFRELLQKGKTNSDAFSRSKPASRGIKLIQELPDSDFVTIPNEEELNASLLGNTETGKKSPPGDLIEVSVINGDLVHSKYPVVVGHFKGDGIVHAEKYLDQALGLKLSEYHFVNNYPGDIGTHLVILDDNKNKSGNTICNGGVVVGLGEFGSLTESRLMVTLTQAFLTLAIRFNELQANKPKDADEVVDFGISSLTVGSDFAGLRITTSVKTIFSAVLQVNEKLDAMSKREGAKFKYNKINHIEVVEIYQHKSIHVGRVIRDFLTQDGFSKFRFVPPVIRPGSGALSQIADENLKDNWHRLEVTQLKAEHDVDGAVSRILPIRFTSITDKAHADENLLPANRLIVDTLVEKMSKHSHWDKAFSQTLYELLVPNNFKGFGASLQNLVLIVDKDTARYPWELLHDVNGISEKPMVINTGILRQLKSSEQRENIVINSSSRALVIGNPFTGDKYPPLPAAEDEANEVIKILVNNGLETTPSIAEHDIDIIKKLMPISYKIIHIASHGIVGKTETDATGIVLGSEIVFSPADFNQIPIVPEFVFVNCCSSARYEPAIEDQMRKKYQLAASVGIQLIQMGVKAAIITGWEIDDAAAQTFSSCFYTSMFKGKSFGEAVQEARSKTFELHPRTNTWGAYQCYGDPFYIFKNNSWTKKEKYNFVEPIEVINELDNLISEVNSGLKRKELNLWKQKIQDIVDALPFSWNLDARIIERLATACQMLKWYEEAIKYYEILFGLENAVYTVRSIEQYYNIKIRLATDQLRNNKIVSQEATEIFNGAIEGLKKLNGKTQERYCLIAASYRRFYEVSNDTFHLLEAARNYRMAYEHTEQMVDYIHFYPFFNWLHFAIILSHIRDKNSFLEFPENLQEIETKALNYARLSDMQAPDFFKKTAPSSSALALLLQAGNEEDIKKFAKEMEVNFSEAWRKEGTASARNSFVDYIGAVIFLLKKPVPTTMVFIQYKINVLQDLIITLLL
ncbi:MAG: CHAT domain-containing protein [Chitinophagaceae bacterium]